MTSPLPYPIHPIASVATQIYQGEDPWYALGCFLHDWWSDAVDYRQDLIDGPPPPVATREGKRWAAFCAAVVEELCARTGFLCPSWTERPEYFLDHPWYYYSQASQRDWLRSTSPESFKRRNIFVGGSVLDNKYELQDLYGSKPRWTIWSDQELQNLLASN